MLQVGYTFWDTRVGDFPNVESPYVKLYPAKGKAAPSEAIIDQDFPGHVLATVTVPEGGPASSRSGSGRAARTRRSRSPAPGRRRRRRHRT
jgi:hypothetical protein